MQRDVCFHFHIFKNAGTTVDWALARFFAGRFATFDGPNPGYVLNDTEVSRFLQARPVLLAISSHQSQPTDEFDGALRIHRLVFIRQPIDRAASVYAFNRRRTDVTPGALMAKKLSLAKYVRWSLRHQSPSPIGNFQVRTCSGKRGRQFHSIPLSHGDLQIAVECLARCTIAGVVERLDESLVVAESELSPVFPRIDLSYERQNVTTNRASDLSTRLDQIESTLGRNLINDLAVRNQLDIALHEAANESLTRRTREIPNFDDKLCEFRRRCSRWSAAA